MSRLVAFLSFVLFVGFAGGASADAPTEIPGATTVNAESLIDMILSVDGLVVVDARMSSDFDAGHIEGALNLSSSDTNAESLAAIIPSTDTPVVFYCNGLSCGRASEAVGIALEAGYSNVYYYARGMEEWYDLGLPVITN